MSNLHNRIEMDDANSLMHGPKVCHTSVSYTLGDFVLNKSFDTFFVRVRLEVTLVVLLWFKYIFGLKFFKPVWFLFSFVSDYGKENKNQTGLKNFKPKKIWTTT